MQTAIHRGVRRFLRDASWPSSSDLREAYGDDTYHRLAEVKAKYDPENVFHNNKNIQPGRL